MNAVGMLWAYLRRADRPVTLLMLVWVLTMISLPIVKWTMGQDALQHGIVIGVLVQVLVVLVVLWRAWGMWRALSTTLLVTLLSWIGEAVGSGTGFVFGDYYYSPLLQPQLMGVPWLVPLAWFMMLPPAWGVATAIVARKRRTVQGLWSNVAFFAVASLAFTAWDLFLDPQMVAWDFWVWDQPGEYFGIPWINFAGWFLVSTVITILARPQDLPVTPLLIIYAITWVLESIGQLFFWGLPGPALFGFLGMGGMLLWAVRSYRT